MRPRSSALPQELPRPSTRSILLSPVRPRTYLNLVYLILAFPLGMVYFLALAVGLSIGGLFAVSVVGVPILLSVLVCCHLCAGFERLTARYLLGTEIRSPGYPFLEADGAIARLRALVFGSETWTAMAYLASKFVIGVASFVLVTTTLSVSVSLLLTPLYYDRPGVYVGFQLPDPLTLTPSIRIPWGELLIGADLAVTITSWEMSTLPEALAVSALGLVLLVISFSVLNGFAWLVGRFTRLLLGESDRSWLRAVRRAVDA
jgi:hypothetical protein